MSVALTPDLSAVKAQGIPHISIWPSEAPGLHDVVPGIIAQPKARKRPGVGGVSVRLQPIPE